MAVRHESAAYAATLDELVAAALAANPEIKAFRARGRCSPRRRGQAGTFDDPMLMLGINNGLIRRSPSLSIVT